MSCKKSKVSPRNGGVALPSLTITVKKGHCYGVVKWHREQRWLGPVSESMHLEFARIRAHVAQHGTLPPRPEADPAKVNLSVGEVADLYERHVAEYYRKDGKATSEVGVQKLALRYLRDRAAVLSAESFGPLALKDCREAMVRNGLTRNVVNGFVGRLRQCFRWAVENQLVAPTVLEGLRAVAALKAGRSMASESVGVKPVDVEIVQAVAKHVSRQVAAMMELQLLTGMRPQEVVQVRWRDIDRTVTPWLYRPARHKNEHHGEDRVVAIGPKGRAVLAQFRKVSENGFLFSPRDAETMRNRARSDARTLPDWPSHDPEHRRARRARSSRVREAYDVASYRRAIKRGCVKAKVEAFAPNQIRHTTLTDIRRVAGLDAAQAVGGHREVSSTQVYSEKNLELAREVIERVG